MKDFFRIALFLVLAPLYLGIGLFMDLTHGWWTDLGKL